jgi:hypothetical protein
MTPHSYFIADPRLSFRRCLRVSFPAWRISFAWAYLSIAPIWFVLDLPTRPNLRSNTGMCVFHFPYSRIALFELWLMFSMI